MLNLTKNLAFCTMVLATGVTLTAPEVHASNRQLTVNAPGACQSALPVFDGNIRKRPRAVQNESTAPAYVSCGFYSIKPFLPDSVWVYAAVNDGDADILSCTGVLGYNGGDTQFVVKTVALPADGQQAAMYWTPSDFTGGQTTFPDANFSISCNLNPGVGINDATVNYTDPSLQPGDLPPP